MDKRQINDCCTTKAHQPGKSTSSQESRITGRAPLEPPCCSQSVGDEHSEGYEAESSPLGQHLQIEIMYVWYLGKDAERMRAVTQHGGAEEQRPCDRPQRTSP